MCGVRFDVAAEQSLLQVETVTPEPRRVGLKPRVLEVRGSKSVPQMPSSPRKDGSPEAVETPAPVSAATWSAAAMSVARASIGSSGSEDSVMMTCRTGRRKNVPGRIQMCGSLTRRYVL